MGKHSSGKRAPEPGTDQTVPFSKMNGAQKAYEFDRSVEDPKGYAQRNFTSDENAAPTGKRRKG